MAVTPVFEVKMTPKDKTSVIVYLIARIEIDDSDKVINMLETEFKDYQIEHVIAGYKQVPE